MWLQSSMSSLTEVDKVPYKLLTVQGDNNWCSETLTFMCLKVLPIYEALQQECRGSGTTSLQRKEFLKQLEVLKTILTLQKGLCNDLASPDLTKADIFSIKGNTEYSCFLGTVNTAGFLIYSLFINLEMHLSMNLLEYPLDKSISLSFSISK